MFYVKPIYQFITKLKFRIFFLITKNRKEASSTEHLSISTYCTYKSNMWKSQTVRLFIINLIQRSFKNVHIISSRVIAIGKKEEKICVYSEKYMFLYVTITLICRFGYEMHQIMSNMISYGLFYLSSIVCR